MRRIRVIPSLLLQDGGLVKPLKFSSPTYVGDPINAVRIFNDKEVDELIFLDISATPFRKPPDIELISRIAGECFIPFCYGGGITTLKQVQEILLAGVEKVAFNTAAFQTPLLVKEAARDFGSSSVVVSIDARKNFFGKWQVWTGGGKINTKMDPVEYAQNVEQLGAGEILFTSMDREGTYSGYEIDLVRKISAAVSIPLIANGGAASIEDFRLAVDAGASAVSAGSLFCFHGRNRAVLINYPSNEELKKGLWDKV